RREGGAGGTVLVPNVVGRLPGNDLTRADEYVVLVAHFDHLGVGEPDASGDSVYNGADDNASGVAALVEVAEAFAALPEPPARPVLFLAVSGTEREMLGSTWYAAHPTVTLSRAVAVLNIDMIGRNAPDSIGVVGYRSSSLGPLVEELAAAAPDLGLVVQPDSAPERDLFSRGDHLPFARRGIPAIRVFSGLHDDYHTPADEAAAVDDRKVARVARLVFLTALRLASQDRRPAWTEAGREAIRPPE
ncbi:MAG: M28 family peptidase, partial [Gemmatimonadota bacterium]